MIWSSLRISNRHYVPAISHRIWKGNQSPCENCDQINFAGLAIGNGLTAPEEQYKWYPEMVWNNSHHIKVVEEGVYDAMKKAVPACTKLVHQCESGENTLDNFACQAAFVTCNLALTSPYQAIRFCSECLSSPFRTNRSTTTGKLSTWCESCL